MTNFSALYDSCVLYPAPLRDLLMYLALTDLFRAKWTDQIHEEWIRNVAINRPDLAREALERTRDKMNQHVRDCLVVGYDSLISGLTLPDPDDRHVLAAAIRSNSSVIVTYNLKDFPDNSIGQYGIEAQHPDEFILHLIDLSPETVCAAVSAHRTGLKNPPKTVEEYLKTMKKQNLHKTVSKLSDFSELMLSDED